MSIQGKAIRTATGKSVADHAKASGLDPSVIIAIDHGLAASTEQKTAYHIGLCMLDSRVRNIPFGKVFENDLQTAYKINMQAGIRNNAGWRQRA